MKTIFEVCTPRPEILSGKLAISDFAARLKDVIDNNPTAPKVYTNPELFFENTYPTEGLKELAKSVFFRLSGKIGGSPAIKLETSFGGGKTHDLITLYHLAKSGKTTENSSIILDSEHFPEEEVKVVGIVAGDMDAVNGMKHPDGTKALTLWGELAYQLRGKEGYEYFKEYDERKTPPQDSMLIEFFGNDKILIMIDEIAKYISVLDDKDYASRIPAFFMSLISVASACSNICFVFTLAGNNDAFGEHNEKIKNDLNSVSARECINLTPAKDKEIAQIITHRIFEKIDSQYIEEIAKKYEEYYKQSESQNVNFAHLADNAKSDILSNYPFHPETLRVLEKKIGSLDNFQKTRGALMMLSVLVRELWNNQQNYNNTYLIHLHHIKLIPSIASMLTSKLDKSEMKAPIDADIYSGNNNSHAQGLDSNLVNIGKPPIHEWVSTSIFLHSLVKSYNKGASISEINFAVANPHIDAGTISQAIERLMEICWHLEPHGDERFFFQPEPSLNKLIAEEKTKIGTNKVISDLNLDIEDSFNKGNHFRIFTGTLSPSEADDLPDKAKLIIVPPDEFKANNERDELSDSIYNLYNKTGSNNMPRNYKNLMYFVFADRRNLDKTLELKREIIALESIRRNENIYDNLSERQKQKLDDKLSIAPLNLKINIANAFCYLAYPKDMNKLEVTKLPLFESLMEKNSNSITNEEKLKNKDTEKLNKDREKQFNSTDRQDTIIRTLESFQKATTTTSRGIAPLLLKKWLFGTSKKIFNTKEILEFFASEPTLTLLLEKSKVRDSIIDGVKDGLFNAKKQKNNGDYDYFHKLNPLTLSNFNWEGSLIVGLPEALEIPREPEPEIEEEYIEESYSNTQSQSSNEKVTSTNYSAMKVSDSTSTIEKKEISKPIEIPLTHISFNSRKTSPENAFKNLNESFKDVTSSGGLEKVTFKFSGFKDVETVISFFNIFPSSANKTFVKLEINMEHGAKTSFEMNTEEFPIDKITKMNLRGLLLALNEFETPEVEMTLRIDFAQHSSITELEKINNALVSKKISEVIIEAGIKI
jgi:hypothetical protein